MDQAKLDELVKIVKLERLEYDRDPILFILKQVVDDLSQMQKYSDNIKLYQITSALPTLVDTVPTFLQDKTNLENRIQDRLFMFTKDSVFTFCIKLDQHYIYINYYQTDSGFSCCQTLSVYFTTSLQLLLVHIPVNQLPDKYKLIANYCDI